MEDKTVIYSREVQNAIWTRLLHPLCESKKACKENEASWYDISEHVTLDISEVFSTYERCTDGMRTAWTGIELIEENEIFIHQSCDCYPNFGMLFLSIDELKNISENLKIGYKYKNIKVSNIENEEITLYSDSQEEKVVNHRNQAVITKGLLKMAIAKLKKEKVI